MSRRRAAEKREVLPDSKYGSSLIAKFMHAVMWDGKKSVAEHIVYGALSALHVKTKEEPLAAFDAVLKNVTPLLEVRSRRVGGATYQVPVDVSSHRGQALALRWIVGAARKRSERTMRDRLAAELCEAFDGRGVAVKKREDTHKMAEANKAFAHYRW